MNRLRKTPRSWIVPKRIQRVDGVRGTVLADIQLVCGAGPYELDILVRQQQPAHLEIVGQVTRGDCIYDPVADLPLSLVEARREETVGGTRTDTFGEFDLASGTKGCFGLRLGPEPDAPCVLVWEGER